MIESFVPLFKGFGVPRADYLSQNSKIPKVAHFDPSWNYQKMQKWFVLNIRGHVHAPGVRTEPIKPMQLTFGDHGLQNKG